MAPIPALSAARDSPNYAISPSSSSQGSSPMFPSPNQPRIASRLRMEDKENVPGITPRMFMELGSLLDADFTSPDAKSSDKAASGTSPRQRILHDRASRAALGYQSPNHSSSVISPPKSLARGVAAMEERVEGLKQEVAVHRARADEAEASHGQLDFAKSQVQVLALAVASIGACLRDKELERAELESEQAHLAESEAEAQHQAEVLATRSEQELSEMKEEVQASLHEAAMRLQKSEASRQGVLEELKAAKLALSAAQQREEKSKQSLAAAEVQREEESAKWEVERQELEAVLKESQEKMQVEVEAAQSAAAERVEGSRQEEHRQEIAAWMRKERDWEKERQELQAQVKSQREELEFAKQCLFSKQALKR